MTKEEELRQIVLTKFQMGGIEKFSPRLLESVDIQVLGDIFAGNMIRYLIDGLYRMSLFEETTHVFADWKVDKKWWQFWKPKTYRGSATIDVKGWAHFPWWDKIPPQLKTDVVILQKEVKGHYSETDSDD